MNYLIHIGTHKTGTTAIQNLLYANRDLLLKKQILYPEIGIEETAHHKLAAALIRKDQTYLSGCFYEIEQTALAESAKWVVLSSEEFESTRNLEALNGCFDKRSNFTIVCFFRTPDRYLKSKYNQLVKMYRKRFVGNIYKFYFTYDLHTIFNYYALSNIWENRFGEKNFKPLFYDHIGQGTKLYNLFLSLLDIELTDEFQLPDKNKINTSLSNQATVYLSRLNALDLTRQQHLSALIYLEDRFGIDGSRLLPAAERKILVERFSGPNNRMAKRFLGIDNAFSYAEDQTDEKVIDYNSSFDIREHNRLLTHLGYVKIDNR